MAIRQAQGEDDFRLSELEEVESVYEEDTTHRDPRMIIDDGIKGFYSHIVKRVMSNSQAITQESG